MKKDYKRNSVSGFITGFIFVFGSFYVYTKNGLAASMVVFIFGIILLLFGIRNHKKYRKIEDEQCNHKKS